MPDLQKTDNIDIFLNIRELIRGYLISNLAVFLINHKLVNLCFQRRE